MARRAQSEEERDVNVTLGQRLARMRKERGFTQVELATATQVVQAVISSYEVGRVRPSPEMILRIADVLQVSTDELLGREPESPRREDPVERRFLRRLRLVKALPKRDQDALLRTIDAFIDARKPS